MKKLTCSVCGREETRELALKDHTPVTKTIKEPTCTSTGTQTKSCSVCGQVLETTTIAAKGHSFSSWTVKTASTCAKKGVEHRTCTICGFEETRELALVAHTYSGWTVRQVSTCAVKGTEFRTCTVCGAEETREIALAAHTYSSWTVEEESTCTVNGRESRTCTVCGAKDTRSLPLADHLMGDWVANPNLHTAERQCDNCDHKEICDHSTNTFTVDGSLTVTCTKCGCTVEELGGRAAYMQDLENDTQYMSITIGNHYYDVYF